MFTTIRKTFILAAILLLASCGDSKKKAEGLLGEKKLQLAELLKQQNELSTKVTALEKEIEKLDTSAKASTAKLVGTTVLALTDFSHYIELQGKIDADNISIVTPRGNPGQVKAVYVKKGDIVKNGQLLLRLDDAIIQQNIRASKESVQTLRTQMNLAAELLKRQQNLWDKGIGTEIQLLTAKNNVESLQTQIKSAEENIKTLLEQLKTYNVYAEVSGVADEVNIRVGEVFSGVIGVSPQIKIVNTSSLKVVTYIPENYISKVGKGAKVEVSVPDLGKTYHASLGYLSASIDPNNRSFETEAKLPSDGILKPNLIALVRILDYSAPGAIAIPVNVVQSDEKGKYVYILSKEGDKSFARKRTVAVGQFQGTQIEIKAGLKAGDQLVTQGFQGLYDGQIIANQ